MGEIDSRIPFESVKAAISLFNGPAFPANRINVSKFNSLPPDLVLHEQREQLEEKFHLAHKHLERFQEKLKNAEVTRVQALSELKQAKNLAKDLTEELKSLEVRRIKKTEERENVASSGLRDMLEKIAEEEKSLNSQKQSLFSDLEDLKREKLKLKLKEIESEAVISELKVKLQSLKVDLADLLSKKPKTEISCNNLISTFRQLTLQSETSRKKSETVKKMFDVFTDEAEALQLTFIPDQSQSCPTELDCGTHKSMGAEIERLDAMKREIEEMRLQRGEALKRVEVAEAEKNAAEGEMKRLRREQLRRDKDLLKVPSPPRTRVRRPDLAESMTNFNKCGKISANQMALLLKGNGLLKKNRQLEGGSYSYLPGER